MPVAIDPQNVNSVTISLRIDDNPKYSFFVHEDGTVNRMGTFYLKPVTETFGVAEDKAFSMGRSEEPFLDRLLEQMDPGLSKYLGKVGRGSETEGPRCQLVIELGSRAGKNTGCEFRWRLGSATPPKEAVDLLISSSRITEQWYLAAKKASRPWWKFW